MQKEKRRNASIRDRDKTMDAEIEEDIPETTRLKAHLKRRVERQTKSKWVQYATEYASEIVTSGPIERDAMHSYLEMTREAVQEMNRKDKEKKHFERDRKMIRTHKEHAF